MRVEGGWLSRVGNVCAHLGLSSRPELISVWREREREGRWVGSGWLATCPDDIYPSCVLFLLPG